MILKPPFNPTWRYQPETTNYLQDITDTGQTISVRSLQHVDKFVRDCKEAGVWSKLLEVLPFAGNHLDAAVIKIKYVTSYAATAVNFVAADYTEATGLLGNGSTKYLNLLTAPNVLGTTNLGFATYNREATTGAGAKYALGVSTGSDLFLVGATVANSNTAAYAGLGVSAGSGTSYSAGFYYAERQSVTDLKLYQNNTQIASSAVDVTGLAAPAINFFAFARNNSGGGAISHLDTRLSFIAVCQALSATERAALYAHVVTLQTNLGRAI